MAHMTLGGLCAVMLQLMMFDKLISQLVLDVQLLIRGASIDITHADPHYNHCL